MHQLVDEGLLEIDDSAFNSLYWDFCFASQIITHMVDLYKMAFQFPLLGFLLCIGRRKAKLAKVTADFQFPLLGFLLCIFMGRSIFSFVFLLLSIPFIGIFALHLVRVSWLSFWIHKTFNSLYWDFCFASKLIRLRRRKSSLPFNSLYWDFCFASGR